MTQIDLETQQRAEAREAAVRAKIAERETAVRADVATADDAVRDGVLTKAALEPVLYDTRPVWELQPGSDVMATTLDGLGPVAITDENAGGVIGDIAYVLSGYVSNSGDPLAALGMSSPPAGSLVITTPGTYSLHTGDVVAIPSAMDFGVGGNTTTLVRAAHDGGLVVTIVDGRFKGSLELGTDVIEVPGGLATDYVWPYLERYDLANKTWLPRIKLPIADDGVREYRYDELFHPSASPDAAFSVAGPFHLSVGELPVPPDLGGLYTEQWSLLTVSYGQPDDGGEPVALTERDADGSVTEPASYPEGDYWVVVSRQLGVSGVCTTVHSAEELGDSLSGSARVTVNLTPTRYAAEGGFAGVIDGKLYFGGGDGDNVTGNEFFVYDPATQEFIRLADFPGDGSTWADYPPYGAVAGKLWLGPGTDGDAWAYDPASSDWSVPSVSGVDLYSAIGDQVQGVEIDGKLYFAYDRVYVFDPVALTVEAKAAVDLGDTPVTWGPPFTFLTDSGNSSDAPVTGYVYDVEHDALAKWDVGALPIATYGVAVKCQGVPFILSGLQDGLGRSTVGVYGLTGSEYVDTPDVVVRKMNTGLASIRQAVDDLGPVADFEAAWTGFVNNEMDHATWMMNVAHSAAQGNPIRAGQIPYNRPHQFQAETMELNLPPTMFSAGQRIYLMFSNYSTFVGTQMSLWVPGGITVSRVDGAAWAEAEFAKSPTDSHVGLPYYASRKSGPNYEGIPMTITAGVGNQVTVRPDGFSLNLETAGVWTARVTFRVIPLPDEVLLL